MILIRKGEEPKKLREFRGLPDATYAGMPKEIKADVLRNLHIEQRGLCAYCTCRIPEEAARKNHQEPMTIEHFYPQNPVDGEIRKGWDLRYGNMHAVCSGNRGCGSEKSLTCDARKGNRIIHLNPCDESILSHIHYRNDGTIYADVDELDVELNSALNLNCIERSLPRNRRAALVAVQAKVHNSPKFKRTCEKILQSLQENPQPFCGFALEWLRKKLRK